MTSRIPPRVREEATELWARGDTRSRALEVALFVEDALGVSLPSGVLSEPDLTLDRLLNVAEAS